MDVPYIPVGYPLAESTRAATIDLGASSLQAGDLKAGGGGLVRIISLSSIQAPAP